MPNESATPYAVAAPERLDDATRAQTRAELVECAALGRSAATRRLAELEREWPLERAVELGSVLVAAVGLVVAAARGPRWLALAGAGVGLLAAQAGGGTSPLAPLLRAAGLRAVRDIANERMAVKALRGDFRVVPPATAHPTARAAEALRAAEA